MARPCNLLFATTMLAGLCVSGLEPASAQKSPNISPPNISPMRQDFNMRAPNILRDRDVSDPGEAAVPNKKASKPNKKTKNARREGGTPGASGNSVVSDRVLKTGSTISGGWREYAADLSWRRVVFTLNGQVATVVFSDGLPGGLLPAVTRFARSGPGPKGLRATYHELRIFPSATPGIRDNVNRSSSIPSDVATRIGQLGAELSVDFKLLQQLMDDKHLFAELGTALDAVRGPADAGGFFPDRPGGSPGEGNWSAPWRGVGRGGPASGDASPDKVYTDDDGNRVVSHPDGSNETTRTTGTPREHTNTTTTTDASGRTTHITMEARDRNGDTTTGWSHFWGDGTGNSEMRIHHHGTTVTDIIIRHIYGPASTPSETGGRGGFDEAWMYQALPWEMDVYYEQWKRESDLVQSGGRIAQPGRGEQSTLILNDVPKVGAEAVVNCGAADTNPCARAGGVPVDPRRGFRSISQPGRGVGPDAPAETGPLLPIPEPAPP